VNLHYQDTWHGALGAQYRCGEKWVFSGGAAFDSSMVDSANRTVTLPAGQLWRFGIGAQYQLSKAVNLGAAYEYMWGGNLSVDQGTDTSLRGRVAGSYNDTRYSFLTVNLTWKL
jgi:long-chain fatty acid transport protein